MTKVTMSTAAATIALVLIASPASAQDQSTTGGVYVSGSAGIVQSDDQLINGANAAGAPRRIITDMDKGSAIALALGYATKDANWGRVRGELEFSKQKADGILQAPDAFFFSHAARIAELTVKHRLAAGFGVIESAKFGALFSYGPDFTAIFRHAATLVDKILKGARPADLPVEQVNVYELVVNLKTARALGIKLPPSFMLQATQTIE